MSLDPIAASSSVFGPLAGGTSGDPAAAGVFAALIAALGGSPAPQGKPMTAGSFNPALARLLLSGDGSSEGPVEGATACASAPSDATCLDGLAHLFGIAGMTPEGLANPGTDGGSDTPDADATTDATTDAMAASGLPALLQAMPFVDARPESTALPGNDGAAALALDGALPATLPETDAVGQQAAGVLPPLAQAGDVSGTAITDDAQAETSTSRPAKADAMLPAASGPATTTDMAAAIDARRHGNLRPLNGGDMSVRSQERAPGGMTGAANGQSETDTGAVLKGTSPSITAEAGLARPASPAVASGTNDLFARLTSPASLAAAPTNPATGSPADAASGTTTLRIAHPSQLAGQVADHMQITLARTARPGHAEFTLRLDPPDMGRIDVRLDVGHDGQVRAVVAADNQGTLDLLRRDAGSLERALADAGLKTDGGALSFNLRQQDGNQREALARPDDGQARSGDSSDAERTDGTDSAHDLAPVRTRRLDALLDVIA